MQAIGRFLAGLPSKRSQTLLSTSREPTATTDQCSAVARLPPEILIDIFTSVRLIYLPLWAWGYHRWHENLGWIVLSHVCRRWRAVILDMPALWGDLRDVPLLWAHEMLRRSRDVDLHVLFRSRGGHFNPVGAWRQRRLLAQVAANAHRLQTVAIVGSAVHAFLQDTVSPAPRLVSLAIDGRDSATLFAPGGSMNAVSLPQNLFAGKVPSLVHLSLSDVVIRAESPMLTVNLTHLLLTRSCGSKCPRSLALLDFINIIRQMPMLETMVAGDILTEPASDAPENSLSQYPAVRLPHLTGLEIRSPWVLNYCHLMQRLELDYSALQLSASITIRIVEGHQDPLLPLPLVSQVYAIQLSSCSPERFLISGYRDMGDSVPPEVAFWASIDVADAPALDGVCFLAEETPLHTVERLSLSWTAVRSASPDWAPILWQLPALMRLDVSTDGAQMLDILRALAEPVPDQAGGTQVVCPWLARLSFPCGVYGPREKAMVFWCALADALEARLAHGAQLVELSVGDGSLIPCADADDIKALRVRRFDGFAGEPGDANSASRGSS